jgi:serine/threonine-protein kinase HipA
MPEELAVWLYGERVAVIEQVKRRLRLTYTAEALANHELGTPLLSVRFPLHAAPYTHGPVKAYVDGLLPEGRQRQAAASILDLPASDTYGLIRLLGRDCAGAVIILPGDSSPVEPRPNSAAVLNEDELARMVRDVRDAPLGLRSGVRLSLAGVQEKLVLTRLADGSWARPSEGLPSTHILKPAVAEFPAVVENEAFCMRFVRSLGIRVADVETGEVGGRRLLIVTRYDRALRSGGRIERIHQEDFCQALGVGPTRKYQDQGGPSLRAIAAILENMTEKDALVRLLESVVANVLIGNADAHGKNYSILHLPDGRLDFAPLYDLVSTGLYGLEDRPAMAIDTAGRLTSVHAKHIIAEAVRWGLSREAASSVLGNLLEKVPRAIDEAKALVPDVPPGLVELVRTNHRRLSEGVDQ